MDSEIRIEWRPDTVADSADSEWGSFSDVCFREKEPNGRKSCVDMYGGISEDESITVAEINKDFKVIDPQLNKADVKQDADGRRVRFAKLLDKSIDQIAKSIHGYDSMTDRRMMIKGEHAILSDDPIS